MQGRNNTQCQMSMTDESSRKLNFRISAPTSLEMGVGWYKWVTDLRIIPEGPPKVIAAATAHGSWVICCPEDESQVTVEPAPRSRDLTAYTRNVADQLSLKEKEKE